MALHFGRPVAHRDAAASEGTAPPPTRRGLLRAASAASAVGLLGGWLHSARAAGDGTLTVALSDNPLTCDPLFMASHDAMILSQNIWENLVEFDINGELRPQLAKALPEISADKLVYSFELRDDVTFQNGRQLTSDDVKYSFEWLLDPANKSNQRLIFSRLSHVETDGPHRLRVVLHEPYAPWIYFLTKQMGIFPAGSREKYGADYFRFQPKGLGTGPGVFEEWKPNDYVSFTRNPNYWQKGLPKWERLVVKVIPEDASRVAYLLSGQADIIGSPPPRDFARLKTRPHIAGDTRATFGGWSVMLQNNARPPFDDINFRRALAHAMDRKTITEKIYYGLVEPSAIPAPASSWWFDPQANDSLAYDLDKAKYYLKQSKYADGASFELMAPSIPYLLDVKDVVVFLQSEFAKIGVEVQLLMGDPEVVRNAMFAGNFQAMFRNTMSPGEPTYMIMSNFTANSNLSKASNFTHPQLDQLMAAAFAETEQDKLKPIYAEVMRLLADQSPYTWLGFFNATNLWRDRVKHFEPSRGMTINVHDVEVS
jgi:peptide/nickel transport system substrate-binding protein